MELRKKDRARLEALNIYSSTLLGSEPYWKQKAQLQEDDPNLADWLSEVLAPSLLDGEAGVERCLDSIESEPDKVLTYLKTGLLQSWWGWFQDCTPDQVATDLLECGFDGASVGHAVMRAHALNYDTPGVMENIFDVLTRGEDMAHAFEPSRPPTKH
jgi:hypothetical protein